MPSTLFDQLSVRPRTNRRPLGTVSVSIALHVAALACLAGFELTTSITGPPIVSRLRAFAVEAELPQAPPSPQPRSDAPNPVAVPNVVPVDSPATITPDAPALPVSAAAGVPLAANAGNPLGLAPPFSASPAHNDPAPASTGPVPIGGAIRPPERVTYVAPVYPEIARAAHVEGRVVLEATIDEWGVVRNVTVRQSVPLLDRAAIEAVTKWRYAPTRLNGQPVAVLMIVTVTFTLK